MVFKPSAALRDPAPRSRWANGDRVFRLFLGIAIAACLWTTLIQPRLPALAAWVQSLVGA